MSVKQKGQPATLSDPPLAEIKQAVSNDPEKYGYHVWDGPALSDYIKATYNIEYGIRACQKLFHRLGFSLLRPQTYPSFENPEIPAMHDLYLKVKRHQEHILNTIRLGLSNARIEAANNKIKLIIRKAYGFRNIDNMLDMVYLVCSDLTIPLPNRSSKP